MAAASESLGKGALPGGGAALFDLQRALSAVSEPSPGKALTIRAVGDALLVPIRALAASAAMDESRALADIASGAPLRLGVNILTAKIEDTAAANILDAAPAVSIAVSAALAGASRILQLENWELLGLPLSQRSLRTEIRTGEDDSVEDEIDGVDDEEEPAF